MLKPNIELIRDGVPQAVLTWHKPDGQGGTIPIAMEFSDALDAGTRQRVVDICERPVNVLESGKSAPLPSRGARSTSLRSPRFWHGWGSGSAHSDPRFRPLTR